VISRFLATDRNAFAFASDDRGVSELVALGILIGAACILAVSLAVFVLVGG